MSKETIQINVIDRDGQEKMIEAPLGESYSLMEILKAWELPVDGTCGGMALCASCHIYILNNNKLPVMRDPERDMLDQVFHVFPNSRLACQIPITEDLDHLKIELAPNT
ncbi:MAG: 2Fe-2S iron-sulfur cluster binding domain-containing protein [Saprospiraceae bacterium]|nr:2Fe-2S iron-sulfur cluster binding domain-containing protein [Saprospiraceae bacterium]